MILKDHRDRKILPAGVFLKVKYIIIKAILGRKSMKKSMFIRLLTVKDTSATNLRTFHPQISEKDC